MIEGPGVLDGEGVTAGVIKEVGDQGVVGLRGVFWAGEGGGGAAIFKGERGGTFGPAAPNACVNDRLGAGREDVASADKAPYVVLLLLEWLWKRGPGRGRVM